MNANVIVCSFVLAVVFCLLSINNLKFYSLYQFSLRSNPNFVNWWPSSVDYPEIISNIGSKILQSNETEEGIIMSLKPKKVNFNEIWSDLRNTAHSVVTLKKVEKNVWNASFRYAMKIT